MDADSKDHDDGLVGRLITAVLTNRDGTFCEAALAEQMGYCVRHIQREFARVMGEPLADFARRIRMERAAGHLSLTDAPIKLVAHEAHYESTQSFSRLFRSAYGLTLTEYRELNPGPSHVMPGYYASCGHPITELPTEVGLFGRDGCLTTMMYDRARHLGGLFPDGHIEPPGSRGNGPR